MQVLHYSGACPVAVLLIGWIPFHAISRNLKWQLTARSRTPPLMVPTWHGLYHPNFPSTLCFAPASQQGVRFLVNSHLPGCLVAMAGTSHLPTTGNISQFDPTFHVNWCSSASSPSTWSLPCGRFAHRLDPLSRNFTQSQMGAYRQK